MQISEYYANTFGSHQVAEYYDKTFGMLAADKAQPAEGQNGGGANFMNALKDVAQQQVATEAPAQQAQTAAVPPAGMGQAVPGPDRIQVIPEDELILSTLSPEAAQKQKELTERLDKLCADYPGVYYRFNPAIFQKMADDPAFEEKIYKAVDDFEAANARLAHLPGEWNRACAMHVDEDGDYTLLSGAWLTSAKPLNAVAKDDYDLLLAEYWEGREDAENALWEIIFSNEAKRDMCSTEELCEKLLPGLPEDIADLARAAIEQQFGKAGKTAGAEEPAETSAA